MQVSLMFANINWFVLSLLLICFLPRLHVVCAV